MATSKKRNGQHNFACLFTITTCKQIYVNNTFVCLADIRTLNKYSVPTRYNHHVKSAFQV